MKWVMGEEGMDISHQISDEMNPDINWVEST